MHALVASPFKSAYNAAKHGIAGFTKTVALELAQKNITCNAICPGYVLTGASFLTVLPKARHVAADLLHTSRSVA